MNQPDRQQEHVPQAIDRFEPRRVRDPQDSELVPADDGQVVLYADHLAEVAAIRQETLREVEEALFDSATRKRLKAMFLDEGWMSLTDHSVGNVLSMVKRAALATLTRQPQVQADPNLSKDLEVEEEVCEHEWADLSGVLAESIVICELCGKTKPATQVDEAESSEKPKTFAELRDRFVDPEKEQLRTELAQFREKCPHTDTTLNGDGTMTCDLCGHTEPDPFHAGAQPSTESKEER